MADDHTNSRRAFLFGLRADGSPTCHPMVAVERQGTTVFNTYRKSAKAQNFHRDPRAAVVLLADWRAPANTAQVLTGVLEETDPIAPPRDPKAATTLSVVPGTVAERSQRRVAEGKRMYFRLKTQV